MQEEQDTDLRWQGPAQQDLQPGDLAPALHSAAPGKVSIAVALTVQGIHTSVAGKKKGEPTPSWTVLLSLCAPLLKALRGL